MRIAGSDTLVLASSNTGKLREFAHILDDLDLRVRPQSDWDVADAIEDGDSFEANALIKARHASSVSALPAIADDSGLVVPALGGAPGILSARYAGAHGDDPANNRKLLHEMLALQGPDRRAFFYCAIALVRNSNDDRPIVVAARWWGEIAREERGAGGFGYDPLFYIPERGCTSAELPAVTKNRISHRARAAKELLKAMESEFGC